MSVRRELLIDSVSFFLARDIAVYIYRCRLISVFGFESVLYSVPLVIMLETLFTLVLYSRDDCLNRSLFFRVKRITLAIRFGCYFLLREIVYEAPVYNLAMEFLFRC